VVKQFRRRLPAKNGDIFVVKERADVAILGDFDDVEAKKKCKKL
jgi:hypothetical protein